MVDRSTNAILQGNELEYLYARVEKDKILFYSHEMRPQGGQIGTAEQSSYRERFCFELSHEQLKTLTALTKE